MTARIQGIISDFLSARGLDDRVGFALSASRALASIPEWTPTKIRVALSGVKSDFFLMSGTRKGPFLVELANRLAAEAPQHRTKSSSCVVLMLSANPVASKSQLALDEEARGIREVLAKSKDRGAVKLVDRWAVRPDDVLQHVNDHRPHVLHFSGHGDSGQIVLSDGRGGERAISDRGLDLLFRAARDRIRIAVLNYCDSLAQARIAVRHIDAAVGMSEPISDEGACVFSAAFYRALSYGVTVDQAFKQGLAALALEGIADDHIPKLLFRRGARRGHLKITEIDRRTKSPVPRAAKANRPKRRRRRGR